MLRRQDVGEPLPICQPLASNNHPRAPVIWRADANGWKDHRRHKRVELNLVASDFMDRTEKKKKRDERRVMNTVLQWTPPQFCFPTEERIANHQKSNGTEFTSREFGPDIFLSF